MQDFQSFLGGLYSRPGIEEAIRRTRRCLERNPDELWDMQDGSAARDLKGIDKKPFLESHDELRTIWSLSYDGFNPYHNKTAGKSASVGCLAMACLSLPPSLRYQENLYLSGVIPGPKQPSQDEINHFVQLLVNKMVASYTKGTFFTKTYEQPNGIRSREAIVAVVADLPASRKVTGCAGHSATKFCSLCNLLINDINNIDWWTWKPATREEQRIAALKWLNAPNKTQRAKVYKETGVRWSPLWDLPYWDPTKYVVVDGMHNLFLGLVKYHFREVLGMEILDSKSSEDKEPEPEREITEKEMVKARKIMDNLPNSTQLRRFRIPVLRALCDEKDVTNHVRHSGERQTKKGFIRALIVSQHITLSIYFEY
jgi:hypothetical protein